MSRLSPLSLSSLVSPNLTDVKNVAAENQKIYILFSFTNASNESWELESVDAFLIVLEMHFYIISDVSNNMRVGGECTDVDVGLIFV